MPATQLFIVTEVASGKQRLIEAKSRAGARNYVAAQAYRVVVPTTQQMRELYESGAVAKAESAMEAASDAG